MNQDLSAETTLSHYRIVSKLGAGGMREVYLAQDTSELGRTVALKILASEVASHKDRFQRFTQEARTENAKRMRETFAREGWTAYVRELLRQD